MNKVYDTIETEKNDDIYPFNMPPSLIKAEKHFKAH